MNDNAISKVKTSTIDNAPVNIDTTTLVGAKKSNVKVENFDVSSYGYVNQSGATDLLSSNSEIKKLKSTYGNKLQVSNLKKDSAGHYYREYRINNDKNGDSHYYLYRVNGDNSVECVVGQTNYKNGSSTYINRDARILTSKKNNNGKIETTTYSFVNNKRGKVLSSNAEIKSVDAIDSELVGAKKNSNKKSTTKKKAKTYTASQAKKIIEEDATVQSMKKKTKNYTSSGVKSDGHNYYETFKFTEKNGTVHNYNIRLDNNTGLSKVIVAITNNPDGTYTHINRDAKIFESKNKQGVTTRWRYENEKKTKVLSTSGGSKTSSSSSGSAPKSTDEAVRKFQSAPAIKKIKSQYGSRVSISSPTHKNSDGTYTVGYKVAKTSKDPNIRLFTYTIDKNGKILEASQSTNTKTGDVAHKDVNGKITYSKKATSSISKVVNDAGKAIKGASSKAATIIKNAASHVGGKYSWGGNSYKTGMDCSHFVWNVLKDSGIPIGGYRSSGEWKNGAPGFVKVNGYANAKPGDVLVFSGHVAILGNNGKMIEAQSTKAGITYNRSVNSKKIVAIYRYGK